jgi:putative transcriptional regulator
MAERKISSTELAERIGTSTVNLSNIKNGKIRGVRFSTLEALCQVLNCSL